MSKTTEDLKAAFAGESQANRRYLAYAKKADAEGLPQIAKLFRAVAAAETAHAHNHLRILGEIRSTAENLEGAIEGETFEIHEMYPAYLETAKQQKERGAQLSFHYALAAEKIHAEMYAKAKESVEAGTDIELGPMEICEVCGYTAEGEIPEKCPICAAKRDRFRTFA